MTKTADFLDCLLSKQQFFYPNLDDDKKEEEEEEEDAEARRANGLSERFISARSETFMCSLCVPQREKYEENQVEF